MINILLLVISIMMVVFSYFRIVLIYIKTKKIKIDDVSGFDLAKEITSNYDEINIVESKEINISKYHLKRGIIRLTNNDYERNDIFTLAITACLSGYSLASVNKDKYLQFLSKILPSVDWIDKTSILAVIIVILTTNVGDAKIAIVLLTIILVYQYIMIEIASTSHHYVMEELDKYVNKSNLKRIEDVLKSFLSLRTISFVVTLILLLTNVLKILNY